MSDPFAALRREERERRLYDFAAACIVAAVQSSMGRSLPEDGDVRDIVRVGRVIQSEIDNPTTPPKQPANQGEGAEPVESDDLVDLLGEMGTLA